MKVMKLECVEEMLLAMLRGALHQRDVETPYFLHATEEDWVRCFRLAVRQGVSALAWEGIERLPPENRPPLDVKLSWALSEKKQQKTYRKHCQTVYELTELYAQHGIITMVLKGVGLSRLYPVPAHREGGDIDIYTYSADKACMTDEEANHLADELMEKEGAYMDEWSYKKHSKFCYKGITFENHRMFLHEAECKTIAKAEEWLKKHMATQGVELLGGEVRIVVPDDAFESVFVALHAAQHYGMGLLLKHLCDWFVMVQQHGVNFPPELDDLYSKRVVNTLTQLCNKYLGLDIPLKGEEDMADEMMSDILHPPYSTNMLADNSQGTRWLQLKNRIHVFKLKRRLLGVSLGGKLRGLLVRKIGLK